MIFIYSLLLLFTFCYTHKININVIHSSILKGIPQLKLHHIILLTTTTTKEKTIETETIAVDFSPINQPSPVTLLKLLAGINVPAEIRIRQTNENISNSNSNSTNTDSIIENICLQHDEHISKQISLQTVQNIKNIDLNNTLHKILQWETYMNLYTHNCQHFSHFVKNIV